MREALTLIRQGQRTIERGRRMIAEGEAKLVEIETKGMLKRASPGYRVPRVTIGEIDDETRREVHRLKGLKMTNDAIAHKLGLRSGGRVSEILTGKR